MEISNKILVAYNDLLKEALMYEMQWEKPQLRQSFSPDNADKIFYVDMKSARKISSTEKLDLIQVTVNHKKVIATFRIN